MKLFVENEGRCIMLICTVFFYYVRDIRIAIFFVCLLTLRNHVLLYSKVALSTAYFAYIHCSGNYSIKSHR
ncbi:unnamed protein product [Brugia timori]|uniref:Ovule protein n=1 Tax=Brugia timori TaxID=42155 RepID=A0A0R3QKD1_9BILA|nr:unnamed protein product [Brugia timori]